MKKSMGSNNSNMQKSNITPSTGNSLLTNQQQQQRINSASMSSQSLIKPTLFISPGMNNNTPIQFTEDNAVQFSDTYNDDDEIEMKLLEDAKKIPQDIDFKSKLDLTIKLKQKILQVSSSSAMTYPLMVALNVEEIKSSENANIDLICVIDNSGSMSGPKIQLVKDTFDYLLKLLSDKDRLSIILFNSSATRITRLLKMNEKGKLITMNKIKAIEATGGTNINEGLCHAFKIIKDRKYVNQVTSIFLLSDGLDNGATKKVAQSLEQFKLTQNFTINTFGYGKDHDPELMNGISQLKDGNFYFIDNLATVDESFVDCFGGLISVAAQDVKVDVKAEPSAIFPEIKIIKAFGGSKLWTINNNVYTTKISQLISGLKKSYILEIQIPKTLKELSDEEKSIKIASTTVSFKLLDKDEQFTKNADLYITFLNEHEEVKDNEPDEEVIINHMRVRQAEILDEAVQLSDQRKYDNAKKLLQDFRNEVANSKYKDNIILQGILQNIDKALKDIRPEVFEHIGKHYMISAARAQMEQRSNNQQLPIYSNCVQQKMVSTLQVSKSKR